MIGVEDRAGRRGPTAAQPPAGDRRHAGDPHPAPDPAGYPDRRPAAGEHRAAAAVRRRNGRTAPSPASRWWPASTGHRRPRSPGTEVRSPGTGVPNTGHGSPPTTHVTTDGYHAEITEGAALKGHHRPRARMPPPPANQPDPASRPVGPTGRVDRHNAADAGGRGVSGCPR